MTAALEDDLLTETFAALANPTRRAIVARLSEGEASVNELAAPFDMTLPAISRHLKVLERAGLVRRGQRAQFRPCVLNPEPLEAIAGWAEHYQHVWDERFDRMADYIRQVQAEERQDQETQERDEQ